MICLKSDEISETKIGILLKNLNFKAVKCVIKFLKRKRKKILKHFAMEH